MFTESDNIQSEDKERLFNIFVSPILLELIQDPKIIVCHIDLVDKIGKYKRLTTEKCLNTYFDVLDKEQIVLLKKEDKVRVMLYIVGPRDNPSIAVWIFDVDKITAKYYLGSCPQTTHTNSWFSDSQLIERFESILQYNDIFTLISKSEKIPLLFYQNNAICYVNIEELKDIYRTYLLSIDKYQILLNAIARQKPFLVMFDEKYYHLYPLVISYEWVNDKYHWSIFN